MLNIGRYNHNQINFKANVMAKNQAEHIDNVLHSGKSVDIFCHSMSDEDTFNSATAFYNYLQDEGIKARIIASGGRENFNYDSSRYNIIQASEVNKNTEKADVALCVDFGNKDRLSPNVYQHLQKYSTNTIVGLDHHDDKVKIVPDFNQISEVYEKNKVPQMEPKNYYIDSSARSNCSIIYRFFEALGKKPSREISKALYTGFTDDTSKSRGDLDKNSLEVISKIKEGLGTFDIDKIDKHFRKKTQYTKEELAFADGLGARTKFSKNNKFAYVEITNNDKEWNDLGNGNCRTKILLESYRNELLANNKNLESVAVFYPCEDNETYKMSITSRKDYALKIVEKAKENFALDMVAGGHKDRCGGTILSTNPEVQHDWVNHFVTAAENIEY